MVFLSKLYHWFNDYNLYVWLVAVHLNWQYFFLVIFITTYNTHASKFMVVAKCWAVVCLLVFLATVKITLLVCWAKSYFPGPVLFWIYMKKHLLQTKNLILCFYSLKRTSMQIMKACGQTPASFLIIISTLVLLQPHEGWGFLFFFRYLRYVLVNVHLLIELQVQVADC